MPFKNIFGGDYKVFYMNLGLGHSHIFLPSCNLTDSIVLVKAHHSAGIGNNSHNSA